MKRRLYKTIIAFSLVVVLFCNYSTASKVEASMGSWKSDANGWWYDLDGSYARGWREIDGYWYFFTSTGYMDYSEYRDGCWLNADGTWNKAYSGGYWASDSTGWWYTDASGWYPVSTWLWIDGSCYYFKASGYMAVDETIDGYYVDASGTRVDSTQTTEDHGERKEGNTYYGHYETRTETYTVYGYRAYDGTFFEDGDACDDYCAERYIGYGTAEETRTREVQVWVWDR